ncbi:hypothetical protein D3C77_569400 [compost metagenome]
MHARAQGQSQQTLRLAQVLNGAAVIERKRRAHAFDKYHAGDGAVHGGKNRCYATAHGMTEH